MKLISAIFGWSVRALVWVASWVCGVALAWIPVILFGVEVKQGAWGVSIAFYVLVIGALSLIAPDAMARFNLWRRASTRSFWAHVVCNMMNLWSVLAGISAFVFFVYPWQWSAWAFAALLVLLAAWLLLTRRGRQAASVTGVGVSTLSSRIGSSLVVVIGIAGVVAVMVALLSMAQGYQDTLRKTGDSETAIVMRGGSASEISSVMSNDSITVIKQAAGIARDADGKPLASPELVVAANLPLKGAKADDPDGSVLLRGVGDEAWKVRPNVKIVAGRKFKPGLRELVAGVAAQRQFAGLQPGQQIKLGSQLWDVVGIFKSGDAMESGLWADASTVASAYRRGSSRTSVTVRLTGPTAFDTFKAALAGDPRLSVDTFTTLEYYDQQSAGMSKIIRIIGMVVGVIMAIGAVFGALNTMFASVATRAREIATLRAIGFRGLPVVVAVMLETMLLALLGGVAGGLIAWLVFNGYTASTLAQGGVSQLSFQFHVSGQVLWEGLKWALAIGFIGGLFPAMRAARLPVATALRES